VPSSTDACCDRVGAGLAVPQGFRHALLPRCELGRLRERAIERGERLVAPFARQRVAPLVQRVRDVGQLLLGVRSGLCCRRRLPHVGGLRRASHRRPGILRRLLRRGERRGFLALRPLMPGGFQVRGHLLDAPRQRVGAVAERALPRRAGTVGPGRVLAVPLRLPALQVLGIRRERREGALDCRAAEQLLAPLELRFELLLRLREALEGPARSLRVEPR